jgi:putative ABC transport system ATP-binding protein
MKPVIEVEGLSKVYPMGADVIYALSGVSFQVPAGAFVALMGPSGSGKSTLMHLLGCLDTPTNGRYRLNGRDVSHLSRRARAEVRNRRIGFVFQSFNLLPRLNTLENVMLPLFYRRQRRDSDHRSQKEAAEIAVQQVGLSDRLHHKPTELSGGQRQRVAIARALVTNPSLILADEPTGNLDSRTGADILDLLVALHENGRTIILVTHEAQVAARAQRVLQMQDGRIVNSDQ